MNSNSTLRLSLLLVIICLFSCNKKNSIEEDWKINLVFKVDTIVNITAETAIIKGSITFSASQRNIWNYGVQYDTTATFPNNRMTSITNDGYKTSISFSDTLKRLKPTTKYYVRVWTLINPSSDGVNYYYSDLKNFQTIKAPLQISLLKPDSGIYRSQFTIKGKGFSRNLADNQVTVNGIAATVTASYDDSLHVMVPKKCGTGQVTVKLGNEVVNGPQFKYISVPYVVYTFAGSVQGYADGAGQNAKFSGPRGLTIDKDGNVIVSESSRIRRITPDGIVSTIAGSAAGYKDGIGSVAQFYFPWDLKVDDLTENIFVVDNYNHCVRIVKSDGSQVKTFAGTDTSGNKDGWGSAARFNMPRGIAKDMHGNLYIADANNDRICKIDGFGQVTTLKSIIFPSAIVFDGDKSFYVSANSGGTIYKLDTLGKMVTFVGQSSSIPFSFGFIISMTIDQQQNLYIMDSNNYCIYKTSPLGQITLFSGNLGESKIVDGVISKARFKQPRGIAIDQSGNIFIADDNCIRKIEKVE
jgi:sugar lactone lactonase YvrE